MQLNARKIKMKFDKNITFRYHLPEEDRRQNTSVTDTLPNYPMQQLHVMLSVPPLHVRQHVSGVFLVDFAPHPKPLDYYLLLANEVYLFLALMLIAFALKPEKLFRNFKV